MANSLLINLQGHWKLDEAPGANRIDDVAHNDAIDNASTNIVAGVIGNAIQAGFGGSTLKYLTVANAPEFVFADEDFTVAGFCQVTALVTSAMLGLYNQSVNRKSWLFLYQQSLSSFRWVVSNDGVNIVSADVSYTTSPTGYVHFAGIHDSQNDEIRFHLTPITQPTVVAAAITPFSGGLFVNTTDVLDIGRARLSSTIVGNTKLDEIAIWRRALTVEDLNDLLVQDARRFPFFISWRPSGYPNGVGYVWTGQDIKPSNSGAGKGLMSVSMSVEGLGVD